MVFMGEENFLKKAFLPPNPHLSKTLKCGGLFFAIMTALDGRASNVLTISTVGERLGAPVLKIMKNNAFSYTSPPQAVYISNLFILKR
jgi:hypothetical protein